MDGSAAAGKAQLQIDAKGSPEEGSPKKGNPEEGSTASPAGPAAGAAGGRDLPGGPSD